MIISHRHRFIFLHNRKTAGSSVAVSLSRYLGPDDLQISAIPETVGESIPLTTRVVTEANAMAFHLLPVARLMGRKIYGRVVARSIDHAYRPHLGRKPPHAPAAKVAATFPDAWENYTKFCVVRNPWDKTVSDYFWRIKGIADPPRFDTYVRALMAGDSLNGIVPLEFHDNWPLYTVDDRIAADHVIRYEDLMAGLKDVTQRIGLAWDGWLPRSKTGTRKAYARKGYHEMYSPEMASIIGTLYAKEAAAFGYTF
ncbi:MAG: hypothetical protein V4747_17300 [Pseudomonadota bacterium]